MSQVHQELTVTAAPEGSCERIDLTWAFTAVAFIDPVRELGLMALPVSSISGLCCLLLRETRKAGIASATENPVAHAL